MSHNYVITLGYVSGFSYKGSKTEAWDTLKQIALAIADNPDRIKAEALKFNTPLECEYGCCTLDECCEKYKGCTDMTFYIEEKPAPHRDAEPIKKIVMAASGDRMLKEHVRRAFCRLVMEDAHRIGLEVNINVTCW